jgi:hypothetical protein
MFERCRYGRQSVFEFDCQSSNAEESSASIEPPMFAHRCLRNSATAFANRLERWLDSMSPFTVARSLAAYTTRCHLQLATVNSQLANRDGPVKFFLLYISVL